MQHHTGQLRIIMPNNTKCVCVGGGGGGGFVFLWCTLGIIHRKSASQILI